MNPIINQETNLGARPGGADEGRDKRSADLIPFHLVGGDINSPRPALQDQLGPPHQRFEVIRKITNSPRDRGQANQREKEYENQAAKAHVGTDGSKSVPAKDGSCGAASPQTLSRTRTSSQKRGLLTRRLKDDKMPP